MRRSRRAAGARGQVLPVLAVTIVTLVAACALAVDVSGALRLRAAEGQSLELAKESSMGSLNAQKFADDPALAAYGLAADALAADGFEGRATIWYYEVPASQMPAGRAVTDRLSVTSVQVTRTYRSALAWAAGKPTIEVGNSISWTSNPYSTTRVWRPSTVTSRAYDVTIAGGHVTSVSFRSITKTNLPAEARRVIDDAVSSLRGH